MTSFQTQEGPGQKDRSLRKWMPKGGGYKKSEANCLYLTMQDPMRHTETGLKLWTTMSEP
ncbi:hypothetical protein DESC_970003 [Desulfosarcina cetonica]|nr:hypothetical protein DESC_970003 [Desulfosarcina cetonica]